MLVAASTVATMPDEFVGPHRLWAAVLARAVLDSLSIDLGPRGFAPGPRRFMVDAARDWLGRPTVDRAMVCDLARIGAADLDRAMPRLRHLWTLADLGQLPPEAVGRGKPRGGFGRRK